MGVGQEEVGPHEVLSCAKQVAFNPSISSSPCVLFRFLMDSLSFDLCVPIN